MFYSHQLLARKAPLGQIWMAATMHAKINRKKLNKLNIIKICEQILNPSVPMALRLSGILMGGVVIVYERKVKLLYDDVTRLLLEINEAWKVKPAQDPTLLPKGKSQAKYDAVTLPDNHETEEVEEIEKSRGFSDFQQTSYIAMRLDNMDEPYVSHNPGEEDQAQYNNQVDPANITLFEQFDSYQADADLFNRFERFDIEGDDETQLNFTPPEHTQIPSTLVPSPPLQEEPQKPDEIQEQHPDDHVNQVSDEVKDVAQLHEIKRKQEPPRKRARRAAPYVMDYDQTIIPGNIYQSWLQNASDMISKRGRKRKHLESMSTMKVANLMELPPVVLICRLFGRGNKEIYYPAPLLELWMRSTQPPHDSPSGTTSAPQPPEPSSSSPSERFHYQDPVGFPSEDYHSGIGSQPMEVSIEKQRTKFDNNDMRTEILMEELRTNLKNNGGASEANGVPGPEVNVMTPNNSGDDVRSIPSSGSGNNFLSHNSEVNSGWSNKKRPYSSSRHIGSGLEPVAEEYPWQHPDPNFKLTRLSENGLTPDNELLVETGHTQTQKFPVLDQHMDQITDAIRKHLKTHFDTPGAPRIESLNQLAFGMNKKRAACLFYQTCVLATLEFIRVEQMVPFGDILISRGVKM